MNVLDLFSGIGGFSLGLERAGMRTVAFCERDPYCRAVLAKHWPDVPCFHDIHAIDADGLGRLGQIDLVCGGFPCQPYSVAGKQKGEEDDRHLWPEMRRVIALAGPAWVIGENVTGLIAMALDDVLSDLEGLGYTARTFVIPAAAVGAPHRRDRTWIVATNTNGPELRQQSGRRDGTHGQSAIQPRVDGSPRIVADATIEHDGLGVRETIARQESESGSDRLEAWRHWAAESGVGRVAYGVPRRLDRYRCLGNAVVPQIPEIIGRAILASICD